MARRALAPATLTAHHDCEFREVLDRVGDKWSLLVIAMLEQRPTARARFSELKRSIPGISQRMLTATLRSLERDGLLTRHVYAEVPPRVEYALTPLGKQFMQPVRGLVTWLQTHWSTIRSARERFDDSRRTAEPREPPSHFGEHPDVSDVATSFRAARVRPRVAATSLPGSIRPAPSCRRRTRRGLHHGRCFDRRCPRRPRRSLRRYQAVVRGDKSS